MDKLSKCKAVILPYVEIQDDVYLMLGKASIGNYGYLGGTQEPGEDIIQTAAREFWEETKKLIPIVDLERRLRFQNVLRKVYKNVTYYFFVVPWDSLCERNPFKFIEQWKKRDIKGDKFNEKIDIKLIHIDNVDAMTRTVRMIIYRVKHLIQFQRNLVYYFNYINPPITIRA